MIPHKQLTLADIFEDCKEIYESDKPQFLTLLENHIDIPTDSLLLVFLHYSRQLREFCGFTKVPNASKITRFKQNFLVDLQSGLQTGQASFAITYVTMNGCSSSIIVNTVSDFFISNSVNSVYKIRFLIFF